MIIKISLNNNNNKNYLSNKYPFIINYKINTNYYLLKLVKVNNNNNNSINYYSN